MSDKNIYDKKTASFLNMYIKKLWLYWNHNKNRLINKRTIFPRNEWFHSCAKSLSIYSTKHGKSIGGVDSNSILVVFCLVIDRLAFGDIVIIEIICSPVWYICGIGRMYLWDSFGVPRPTSSTQSMSPTTAINACY